MSYSRCCALPACAQIPTPPPSVRNGIYPRVALIGDSLTAGYNASRLTATYGYSVVEVLRQRNAQNALYYDIWGNCGCDTITHVQQLDRMGGPNADLIVVELGTVDFIVGISSAEFVAEYVTLLDVLRTAAPAAFLVSLGVWGSGTVAYDQAIQDALAYVLPTSSAFIPLTSLYSTPGYRGNGSEAGDTMHPNDTGYAAIATAILEQV